MAIIKEIVKREKLEPKINIEEWAEVNFGNYDFDAFDMKRIIKRGEMALLLDKALDPFSTKEVDIHGNYMN